jgi:hypothetical protein
VSLKSSSAHSDRDGPAVINPEAGVTPGAVGVVVVVVVAGEVVVVVVAGGVVVVVVAGGVVVVTVASGVVVVTVPPLPPPPPPPSTGAEVVGVVNVALLLPPGTAVVLVVGAVDSVIGERDVTGDQYFVRLAKRLLPNQ